MLPLISPSSFLRDAIFLVLLGLAVRFFAPDLLFSFVKRAPWFWALVMLAYPLVSVYPQELLYRAFFFHRYQPLVRFWLDPCSLPARWPSDSSTLFSEIGCAVALCVAGGLLFAFTYQHSGSLLLTCIDHALFGNFIFTIGLGRFFYHGSRL